MNKLLFSITALAAASVASPALAIVVPMSCTTTTTPAYTACVGDYTGQVLDNSPADQPTLVSALGALGVTYGSGTFGSYTTYSGLGGATNLSTLLGTLVGIQVLGVHYGGGAGGGITDFYKIDFGAGGTLTLNSPNSSSITLFSHTSGVPEPATWAMMLLGFGGIGFSMRRKRQSGAIMQIA